VAASGGLLAVLVPETELELVMPDRTRVPVRDEMTLGRASDSTLRLDDPTVSRRQARISVRDGVPYLEDSGSTYGTWVDEHRVNNRSPLRDGSRIRMGNQELVVERPRDESEAGRTVVVPSGASAWLPAAVDSQPRIRSGYALKRLEASEGQRRWVLRDLESERFLRMSDEDAELFQLIDGRRDTAELLRSAEAALGTAGPPRLARLLSELAERGLLSGVEGAAAPKRRASGLLAPHEKTWEGAGDFFAGLYRRGGRRLFTAPSMFAISLLIAAGLVAFPYLVAARYGTPFVVASKIGIGGLVFLVARFAVVAVHETAHGLTMAEFGRTVQRAGLKLVLIFPYAYVDTSEAWFEPRRRRIAVSAAGPVSDFSLGALFALCCLALPAGTLRDVFFQLAFAAYLGGCLNLNPFVERDGYQILVDALGEPNLRRRAREQLARRLSGRGAEGDSRVLTRYAAFGLAWTVLAACFAVGTSLRYEPHLAELAPEPAVWALMGVAWLALFTPALLVLVGPLRERRRASVPET
jgi:putative peptide zinc metalloprotease protein